MQIEILDNKKPAENVNTLLEAFPIKAPLLFYKGFLKQSLCCISPSFLDFFGKLNF